VAWWVFVLGNTNKLEGVWGRDYRGAGLVESAVVLGVDAEETTGGADTLLRELRYKEMEHELSEQVLELT
jgi:hypothetical protein